MPFPFLVNYYMAILAIPCVKTGIASKRNANFAKPPKIGESERWRG